MTFLDWCIKTYDSIVERGKIRSLKGYSGRHHIKPRSIFPEFVNDKENIVLLTGHEHFLCHWLLYEIYRKSNDEVNRDRMAAAWFRISYPTKNRQITAREYELARMALSESKKNSSWWNNGNINAYSKECPGEGWIKGRHIVSNGEHWWTNGNESVKSIECPEKDGKEDFIWATRHGGQTEQRTKNLLNVLEKDGFQECTHLNMKENHQRIETTKK